MSIILKNVNYMYMPGTPYAKSALEDINLSITPGEFIGVIGHTGSGKSTLMQHFNGLLQPHSGAVEVDGVDIKAKTEEAKLARRKVGMVFQYPEHQLFEETIFDDIAFGPRNMAVSEPEVAERVQAAMDFVGLAYAEFSSRSPFQLSGGQMRRVAIAGVIAMRPQYLVLDEPSAGLDPRGRNDIFDRIVHLHEVTGIGVVLVSHNMEEVAQLVNRLIVMEEGRIILDGNPADIFHDHIDELHSAGVDVPQVTGLLTLLHDRGLDVDKRLLTVKDAVRNISGMVTRRMSHAN